MFKTECRDLGTLTTLPPILSVYWAPMPAYACLQGLGGRDTSRGHVLSSIGLTASHTLVEHQAHSLPVESSTFCLFLAEVYQG